MANCCKSAIILTTDDSHFGSVMLTQSPKCQFWKSKDDEEEDRIKLELG